MGLLRRLLVCPEHLALGGGGGYHLYPPPPEGAWSHTRHP